MYMDTHVLSERDLPLKHDGTVIGNSQKSHLVLVVVYHHGLSSFSPGFLLEYTVNYTSKK